MIFNRAHKIMQYCNGEKWIGMDGSGGAAGDPASVAKAWVTFNGTNGNILSGYNVSSVTRNSAGRWTVNFTKPMPNTAFATNVTCMNTGNSEGEWTAVDSFSGSGKGLNYVRIMNYSIQNNGSLDCPEVYVTIFAN